MDKTRVLTALFVAFFAYFGALVRVLLAELSSNMPDDSLLKLLGTGFFLPNIVGCFVMGIVSQIASTVPSRFSTVVKGVSTGFCGSCTTFATWQTAVGVETLTGVWINALIIQSAITFATSLAAFIGGKHLGSSLAETVQSLQTKAKIRKVMTVSSVEKAQTNVGETSSNQADPNRGSVFGLMLIGFSLTMMAAIAFWLLFWLDGTLWRRNVWIAVCLAPFGAVLRYILSWWNERFPNFPVMTFAANMLAVAVDVTIVIAGWHVKSHYSASSAVSSAFSLWMHHGVATGAMGSLSTVSTWMSELCKLDTKHAYVYGAVSMLVGQSIVIAPVAISTLFGHHEQT